MNIKLAVKRYILLKKLKQSELTLDDKLFLENFLCLFLWGDNPTALPIGESDREAALDAIAFGIKRDPSYVLNKAVAACIEMYQWQIEEIQKGIAEANAGDFASDEEVKATFVRLTNVY